MANDGEVKISTSIDTSNLNKQLTQLKTKMKGAANDINATKKSTVDLNSVMNEAGGSALGFAGKLKDVATTGGMVTAAIVASIAVLKSYIKGIRETSDAYRAQADAEAALTVAAANNPYINGEGVDALKTYADNLQKVTEISDNQALEVMAQLVSTGRNEAQVMQIMSAAADYAAATHTDLSSAAMTLNMTLNGTTGALGRQHAEIKNLTEEELKNGAAVDIIAKKYKGFATELANSQKKAENAKKKFQEALGSITNPSTEAWDNFWQKIYLRGAEYIEKLKNKLIDFSARWYLEENVIKATSTYISDITGDEVEGVKLINDLMLEKQVKLLEDLQTRKAITDQEASALIIMKDELRYRQRLAEYEEKQQRAAAEKAQKESAPSIGGGVKAKTANDYARESNKALQDSLRALEVEAKAKGKAVTAQDKYNVYLQNYIDLLTKTEGKIKEGYPVEKKRWEQLQIAKKAAEEAATAEEKLAKAIEYTQQAAALLASGPAITPGGQLKEELETIERYKKALGEMTDAEIEQAQAESETKLTRAQLLEGLAQAEVQATKDKVDEIIEIEETEWDKKAKELQSLKELRDIINESEILSEKEKLAEIKKLNDEYTRARIAQAAVVTEEIEKYTSQAVNIAQEAAELMTSTVKNQSEAELATLEIKYRKGEIGEEEYNKKVTDSKKRAAKEQYKIDMFKWTASLAQAAANIAQGITAALSQTPPASFIQAAAVAASGGTQIASLIAAKPIPPNFTTGGIVGGSSYYGDNVAANLNSREMVLNMNQQKGLWDFVNNGSKGTAGTPNIIINNSASNIVKAQPQLRRDQIEIMIDARVNDSLKNGRYTQSLTMAQQAQGGEYYGI